MTEENKDPVQDEVQDDIEIAGDIASLDEQIAAEAEVAPTKAQLEAKIHNDVLFAIVNSHNSKWKLVINGFERHSDHQTSIRMHWTGRQPTNFKELNTHHLEDAINFEFEIEYRPAIETFIIHWKIEPYFGLVKGDGRGKQLAAIDTNIYQKSGLYYINKVGNPNQWLLLQFKLAGVSAMSMVYDEDGTQHRAANILVGIINSQN